MRHYFIVLAIALTVGALALWADTILFSEPHVFASVFYSSFHIGLFGMVSPEAERKILRSHSSISPFRRDNQHCPFNLRGLPADVQRRDRPGDGIGDNWSSWSSTQYSAMTDASATPPTVAHQMVSQRVYFSIPSSGTGTLGTNYSETDYGYDKLERRNRLAVSGGILTGSSTVYTITRTVWTAMQWVDSVWMGTDDNGATDADPTGGGATGNNMVKITENQYDGGAVGDGTLTQVTQYTPAPRVTGYGYDFRDRRTSMTDALGAYTVYTFDNFDRQTEVQQYISSGGYLMAQNKTNFGRPRPGLPAVVVCRGPGDQRNVSLNNLTTNN